MPISCGRSELDEMRSTRKAVGLEQVGEGRSGRRSDFGYIPEEEASEDLLMIEYGKKRSRRLIHSSKA